MDPSPLPNKSKYLMLALDHREGFKKILNPNNPDSVSAETIIEYKRQILDSLKDKFSACLLDDEYGLKAFKQLTPIPQKPYLLAIENSGYKEVNGERITVVEKTAKQLKDLGAFAIKLLLYFNLDKKSSYLQLETAKNVISDAHNNELPVFLEIVSYDMENEDRVVQCLETFIKNGIVPDVFKLEFPGNEQLCREVNKLCGSTPWILLTRGADYSLFCDQLEIATRHGCQGFLAGRSLWQELLTLKDTRAKEEFLKTTLPSRFDEIKDIVNSYSAGI